MWVLVFVILVNETAFARTISVHEGMDECFKARDVYSISRGPVNGTFYKGTQAVCIPKFE